MPMIDFFLPEPELGAAAVSALVERATAVVSRYEAQPDTALARSVAWSFVHRQPRGTVYAGGVAVTRPHVRIDVSVMSEMLGARAKGAVVRELTELALEALGYERPARYGYDVLPAADVMVRIIEVPAQLWGVGGHLYRPGEMDLAKPHPAEPA